MWEGGKLQKISSQFCCFLGRCRASTYMPPPHLAVALGLGVEYDQQNWRCMKNDALLTLCLTSKIRVGSYFFGSVAENLQQGSREGLIFWLSFLNFLFTNPGAQKNHHCLGSQKHQNLPSVLRTVCKLA